MSNYVYIESERWQDEYYFTHVLYTVGFYAPNGKFIPESDHNTTEAAAARTAHLNGAGFDIVGFINRQHKFSQATFGPYPRTQGVINHIKKELREVEKKPDDVTEWCDIILLAIDGALRHGSTASKIVQALDAKLTKNEGRDWPDWRTLADDQAIEHNRKGDE